jgi:hypothetical protein
MLTLKRLLTAALLLAGLGLSYRSLSSQVPSARSAVTSTLHGDASHPDKTTGWVDTHLYFGLGPADAPGNGVTESAWRDFLDKQVSPRFPSGFSVLDVYGQWQSKSSHRIERIRTKLLLIDYPATPENLARIDAIRAAWKQRTGDQSVLRVTHLRTSLSNRVQRALTP